MADIARLDRALKFIEEHPDRHDQGAWMVAPAPGGGVDCGTAACLAGWVVAQEYPEAVFFGDQNDMGNTVSQVQVSPGSDSESIERLARKLLGIDHHQGTALFAADNSIDHLKAMRDVLAANPDVGCHDMEAVHFDDDTEGWDGE